MGLSDSNRLLHTVAFTVFACSPAIAQQQDQLPDSPTPIAAAKVETPPPPQFSSSSAEDIDLPTIAPHISASPGVEITVLEDTLLRVRTNAPLSTSTAREGAAVLFTLSKDVVVDNVLVIPRGATLHGMIVQNKKAGTFTGTPDLTLKLTSLDLADRNYPVYSYQFRVAGTSKNKPTEAKIKGGAVVGALAGEVVGVTAKGASTAASRLASAGAGAAIGAGLGTLAAAASSPAVTIPAESQIDFYLASPIAVLPPTAKDAQQLSHLLHTGEPVLYVRGETP
ncbi:hypothetical protein SAMN05421771_4012 [Granulicella pectinivorans]|uniref:Conjugation TrbI-like protein n=1 Tax=Granulicella pectinivorans TaxID=474950 RepID=A0A1I6MZ99_9BACT|nr:hypothetical protein SAMN05421771_4012 [Granulicella pectinivorans]